MKNKKLFLTILYSVALVLILFYPASRIILIEFPAEKPIEMKFKVGLRDPYDPMRGRYVMLELELDEIPVYENAPDINYRDDVFLVLAADEKGFARAVRLEKEISNIKDGEIYVKVEHAYRYQDKFYRFVLPFRRFYLNEFKAPQLEKELRYVTKAFDMVLTVKFFRNGLWAVSDLQKVPKIN